jgi:hypothetical protein
MVAGLVLAGLDPAKSEVMQVSLPAYASATLKFDSAETFATPAGQDDAFGKAAALLARAARSLGIEKIGVPFVRNFTQENASGPGPIMAQFCSVVATDQEPTELGVTLEKIADAKVLADVCPTAEAGVCEERIRKKLAEEPWKLDDDAIDALTWRTTPVANASGLAANVAAALTDPSRYGIATGDAAPSLPPDVLPFVVVAVTAP